MRCVLKLLNICIDNADQPLIHEILNECKRAYETISNELRIVIITIGRIIGSIKD